MPNYSYVAINISGNEIRGEHVSPDERGVATMLQQQGYYPTSIKKAGGMGSINLGTPRLPVKIVARLCTQVSAMLRSGVPIVRTLEILTEETDNKLLRTILEDVNAAIRQGSSFSEAITPHRTSFPVLFHSMVEAGEASGTLDACLGRAGASFTRAARLNSKVKGAMIYPSIILTALIGLLLLMMLFVVPQFAQIYADGGAELPAFTQALLGLSGFLQTNGIILLAVTVAGVVMISTFFKTEFGKYRLDRFKTQIPVLKVLVNKIYAARFTRSLASLVSAGVNMPDALDISSRTVLNTYLQKGLENLVAEIKQGVALSDAIIKMGTMPPLVASVVKIGEETGELEEMLIQVAEYYDEESDSAISAMVAMMEPSLIILMAAIVVPVLLGVLQPMFGMVDAIT